MNKYLKEFLHRGLLFGGFGPIVTAIVVFIVSLCVDGVTISGGELLVAVLSTYALGFIQAGASVFNQIEEWPITKSLFFHFLTLFVSYSACYLVNSWIPFEPMVLAIFALVFIATYFIIWLTVYFIVRATGKDLNRHL